MTDEPAYGDNMMGSELRAIILQIEQLTAAKAEIAEHISEIMKEAKDTGWDVNAIKRIIAMRRWNPDDLADFEMIVEAYRNSLGMRPYQDMTGRP